jgi:hypothetical protein
MNGRLEELIDDLGTISVSERGEAVVLDEAIEKTKKFQETPGLVMYRCSRCRRPTAPIQLVEIRINRTETTSVCRDCLTVHDCLN